MKQRHLLDLPAATGEALTHHQTLVNHIRQQIVDAGGAITFEKFMALALYAPGLGYYVAGAHKLGEAGDFITAPQLSPLFSRSLAQQIGEALASLGQGDLLEAGGGSGVMARDILLALEAQQCLPRHYYILEVSPDLRQRQQQTLEQGAPHLLDRVTWLDNLPEPGFSGVVIGNEVLDAMPVHLIDKTEQGWRERYVGWDGEAFIWRQGPLSCPQLEEQIRHLESELGTNHFINGYTTEINLAASGWIHSIGAMMERGVALLIDYGFPQHEYYHPERTVGTLMCHYRHRAHDDPLILAGLQDITAHVDFTAIAQAGVDSGMAVLGYTSQAYFLLANGLTELAHIDPEGEIRQHLDTTQQIKKLTLPSEMGELFKVIALGKNYTGTMQGFALHDRRDRL